MAEQEEGNIKQEYNNATTGLNLDQTLNQVQKGRLTYALNAAVENFDSNSVNYQNEPGNEFCVKFPEGYVLIGEHFIIERNKHVFFLTNPSDGGSQIGYMDNNDCVYRVLVNAPCLNFNIDHPIHKIVHRITNCNTEIYWTDGFNPRRYLDIDDIPKVLKSGSPLCSPVYTDDLDCNQLKLQPNFNIPTIDVTDVISGGNLIAGTYQFAVQYSDPSGNPFTSYYSVTNPTPIADEALTTVNFNYPVGKSIVVNVSNLDTSGQFEYFNLAVIKTINGVPTPQLVGTYFIDSVSKQITYTGQFNIDLAIEDIFEKFPYYEIAQDLTAVQDVLVWDQLTSIDRINYQQIAAKISLQWETWRIPANQNYADEINATNLRGYLRDEVYAFEIVFLLKNGKQTDGFHIPGRTLFPTEELLPRIPASDPDFIGEPDPLTNDAPYWKIYNTAKVNGNSPGYTTDQSYKGPYQFGEFAYWESTEEYPCNKDVWGDLAGQKIRHHKFPDVNISPIYESKIYSSPTSMVMGDDAIFPIGVKIDPQQISFLISTSNLTDDQKADIVGYKIVRGDRSVNKSIVAKGMLRNVGEYTRDEQSFYFPNYPYNDLNEDPFLTSSNNAYQSECKPFNIYITEMGTDPITGDPLTRIQYNDCSNGKLVYKDYTSIQDDEICSVGKPVVINGKADIGYADYDVYTLDSPATRNWTASYDDRFLGPTVLSVGDTEDTVEVVAGTAVICTDSCSDAQIRLIDQVRSNKSCGGTTLLDGFKDDNRYRQIFNSPETSFGQPFLGNIVKLESVMFGTGKAHFVEVKDNAKYKLITEAAQKAALDSSAKLGAITSEFSATAMFTAYQAYLQIYINGITRKNYAYSFNSIADYNYGVGVPDQQGIKQRQLETARYLIPGVQAVGDDKPINNWNRESSVFIKTDKNKTALPFPNLSPNTPTGLTERSRFTISEINNCGTPAKEEPIQVVSYYASIKNDVINQWGQLYTYETIDTGYQYILNSPNPLTTVFGGDTFINRFAYKTKLPFFIDNRVNAPDDSDIFYDEIGNVAYPRYWHSARSILKNYSIPGQGVMANIISYKAHNFDCPNEVSTEVIVDESTSSTTTTTTTGNGEVTVSTTATYYDGYFYLFAYGIPNFYCETSYNVDLRQAFNNREGDFWPHVSTDIPDDWVQESFVTIAQDNTYYYNTTFSKQNRENTFTHLPPDWEAKLCFTNYPFRAIYSDVQNIDADNRVNNWLIYRAVSYFDFPQNYGNLVSLDGIQNRAILARFENKTLMYNNLLTIDTSNPQAAYIGNPNLFRSAPPIDFAETDLGYVGSQHKFLMKIPQGQITVDAKRGQVFLIQGTQAVDLSAFGSGMNRFFVEHLPFMITKSFPTVNIDNHFNGIGLHGVYDAVYDRVIITKLDRVPNPEYKDKIKYDEVTKEFYIEEEIDVPPPTSTTTTTTTIATYTLTVNNGRIVGRPLILTWQDIGTTPVDDPYSLSDWNTFFDLPNYGNPFTDIIVIGNSVYLIGGSNITIKAGLFSDGVYPNFESPQELNGFLINIEDRADCVVRIEEYAFAYSFGSLLTTVILPALTYIEQYAFFFNQSLINLQTSNVITVENYAFFYCSSIVNINLPLLTSVGDYGFSQTRSVVTYYFPSLITAGEGAFDNTYIDTCKTIDLPVCISVGNNCFQGNEGVTYINLPVIQTMGTTSALTTTFNIFDFPELDITGDGYVPQYPIYYSDSNGVFTYLGSPSRISQDGLEIRINSDMITLNDGKMENDLNDLAFICEIIDYDLVPGVRVHVGSTLVIVPVTNPIV